MGNENQTKIREKGRERGERERRFREMEICLEVQLEIEQGLISKVR